MPEVDIVGLSFEELASDMAEGRLTSESLVRECLARISLRDETLHSFVEVFHENAISHAQRLDAERGAGKIRGPLHGIPIAIKDVADIKGHITGFGSRHYGTAPAATTANFLGRLQEAGMVVLGKTQMVEFAFGSWGTNAVLGTPRNPHGVEEHYIPGGSSSGSAVAVAGGLVPAAIGSDTGGSVRIPAGLCGVVGLKTTVGRVDTQGVAPLSATFDTLGPLTNCVDDARMIFEAMRDDLEVQPGAPLASVVRYCQADALEPVDPNMIGAIYRAIEVLGLRGLDSQPLSLPESFSAYQANNGAIMAKEAFTALRPIIEDKTLALDQHVRERVAKGAAIGDAEYAKLIRARNKAAREFESSLGVDQILLLPTTPFPSIPLREVDESVFPMSRFTRIANYLGLCGISLPVGFTGDGLPVGIQLLARGGQEEMLLRTASLLESSQNIS